MYKTRIGVIGSRTIENFDFVDHILNRYIKHHKLNYDEVVIVSGGSKGADILGKKFHLKYETEYLEYKPNWDEHGKKAGFLRNSDIVNNSDVLFVFWDGVSRGTLDSIKKFIKLDRNIYTFIYNPITCRFISLNKTNLCSYITNK